MSFFAHLPDPFFSLPFRCGKDDVTDWRLCMKYIIAHHAGNNSSNVEEALKRMNSLRKSIVKTCRTETSVPPTETFIESTLIPYCQLVAMAQAHFPLYKGKVHRNMIFCWKDSFDFYHENESQNANLELICCIYNLAASWAYIAGRQASFGGADDIKNAFKNFQNAAGYYEMVEQLLCRLPAEHVDTDLHSTSLTLLRQICLTMAHHCAYLKAEIDMKGNNSMLAKIAREAGKQYEETATLIKGSMWYKKGKKKSPAFNAEQSLTATSLVFYARSHMHMSALQEDYEGIGLKIAHLRKANEYLLAIPELYSENLKKWVKNIISNVEKEHEKAVSTNESVYFVRIPKEVETPNGLPKPLGRATCHPCFIKFESKRDIDPFFGIFPAHIAGLVGAWRENQRKAVSACTNACSTGRTAVNNRLQVLGVDTVIAVLSGEVESRGRVPASLRERIESLRKDENGETIKLVETLLSAVKTCEELGSAANAKLAQIKAELESERKEDEVYLNVYGERMWRGVRPPSTEVVDYVSIQSALQEHEKGLQQCLQEPLRKAKDALTKSLRYIARLDSPMSDLDALMPFVDTEVARQQNKNVLDKVDVLKKLMQRRKSVEEEQKARLQELSDLIECDAVTATISSVEESQRDVVFARETQRITDAIERANGTARELEKIVAEMEEVMNSVSLLQSSDPIVGEMQKLCNGLEDACTVYMDLRQELQDITRYALSLLDWLEMTHSSAMSFRVCRKLEAEGLRENFDAQIAQKVLEMEKNTTNFDEIRHSQRRQEELRSQIELLEKQEQQKEPTRAERMAEIMRRQREMAAYFNTQQQPEHLQEEAPPPSYDSVINPFFQKPAQHPQPPMSLPQYRPL